jgi:AhpD family alkylhydroperoxidase
MNSRLNHFETVPGLMKELIDLSMASIKSSIDHRIKNLIEIRASQMNGCAFCLDIHVKQGKIAGEKEIRMFHVPIWRDSPLFTAKERAALELTEAMTHLGKHGVPDDVYATVKEHFTDVEISELTFAIGIINLWNRIQILAQAEIGSRDAAQGLEKAGYSF